MENEEKFLLGCPFFTEDSFSLSDYLHRQAERASNRLFNNGNPLWFLRSRIFSSEFEQKEGEEILDRCSPPVLKSMPVNLSSVQKESSESFTGKECSSHVLSELEQGKRGFSPLNRTLTSSDSCVESSQCCELESAAEAATMTDLKAESLHNNMLCCESKQAISVSNDEKEDDDGSVDAFRTERKNETGAFNLLLIAAMQHNEDGYCDDAALLPLAGADSSSEAEHGASPVHGSSHSPILKKRVIRRAKSAFQKQVPDGFTLPRIKFPESVVRPLERKRNYATECLMKDQGSAPIRHKVRVGYAKRRKLQDLSLSTFDTSVKVSTNVDEDPEGNCDVDKTRLIGCLNVSKCELSEFGRNIHSEGGNLQMLYSELPNDISTESSKIAHRKSENHCNFINHRKLQISSSRLLDACNTAHLKGTHMKDRHAEQSTANNNCSSFKASNGLGIELDGKRSIESDKEADFRIAPSCDTKHGNSILRLKILPIRLPSTDLSLLQDVSKIKGSELVTENRMVTRKRSTVHKCNSISLISPLVQQAAIPMVDTQIINTDPVMRTKRGRSQILPTKFSDSVLQPWKSSRRKIRVLNA